MKIVQLNHSDINGGAARAAYRIHHALRNSGVDSRMWVNKEVTGDWTVEGPGSKVRKALVEIRPRMISPLVQTLRTGNLIIHSPQVFPSQWVKRINGSDADAVNLHWIQGEMLSIADVGRINKPIVWTLHDMWAFCGAEHYTEDYRWREGYLRDNRPEHESRVDVNRWTWNRKCKHWQQPIQIVTPSRWLANCVRESALMRGWPVTVIPNPIHTDRWQPLPQSLARELLGLPADASLLLFGAMGGGRDPRKGFDLLQSALEHLRDAQDAKGIQLIVFGQLAPKKPPDLGFPLRYAGHLHDDLSLRVVYSAADVMIVPSRQEAFGQTASEAHACGTPVVAFDIGGLSDIVLHRQTGYLAKAFDVTDLANGIRWVLENGAGAGLEANARKHAVSLFSYPVVARQYEKLYQSVIAE